MDQVLHEVHTTEDRGNNGGIRLVIVENGSDDGLEGWTSGTKVRVHVIEERCRSSPKNS